MELKQMIDRNHTLPTGVLIVPYGIETLFVAFIDLISDVLIVPYGIETIYILLIRHVFTMC